MDDSNAIYWHPHHIVYTQHYVSWDMEISVTKVSGNVELVEKICPLWLTLCTLCYVWSWAWILFGRNHAHEMFDHKCVLSGWLGRPLHSFACKFCIGYDAISTLLCRHCVQAAWVGWLKYCLLQKASTQPAATVGRRLPQRCLRISSADSRHRIRGQNSCKEQIRVV